MFRANRDAKGVEQMHRRRRAAAAVVTLGVGVASLVALTTIPASAASPNSTTGTADCGSAGAYTFSASGNSGQGTSWNVAFVTASDGSRGLFHPTSFDFTFTAPDGTVVGTEDATKPGRTGPVSCEIVGHPVEAPLATLSGTVTGWITSVP
jgi:hypothetical protein